MRFGLRGCRVDLNENGVWLTLLTSTGESTTINLEKLRFFDVAQREIVLAWARDNALGKVIKVRVPKNVEGGKSAQELGIPLYTIRQGRKDEKAV